MRAAHLLGHNQHLGPRLMVTYRRIPEDWESPNWEYRGGIVEIAAVNNLIVHSSEPYEGQHYLTKYETDGGWSIYGSQEPRIHSYPLHPEPHRRDSSLRLPLSSKEIQVLPGHDGSRFILSRQPQARVYNMVTTINHVIVLTQDELRECLNQVLHQIGVDGRDLAQNVQALLHVFKTRPQ